MEELIGFFQLFLLVGTILLGTTGFCTVEMRCELEIQITFQKTFQGAKAKL